MTSLGYLSTIMRACSPPAQAVFAHNQRVAAVRGVGCGVELLLEARSSAHWPCTVEQGSAVFKPPPPLANPSKICFPKLADAFCNPKRARG